MKRIFCLMLALTVLVLLPACDDSGEEAVSFYYLRREYTLGNADSVIAYEQRDLSGRQNALNYLLGIYLNGPLDDQLVSPFPGGTRLVQSQMLDQTLVLELSSEFFTLDGIRLTLGASCLAHTCFQLTEAETVQITGAGEIPITLTRESMTLLDDSISATGPSEAEQ